MFKQKPPRLRNAPSEKAIRIVRVFWALVIIVPVVGLLVGLAVALAHMPSANDDFDSFGCIFLMLVVLLGAFYCAAAWDGILGTIPRSQCEELMKRLETRQEFLAYRDQVLGMGRLFTQRDVSLLDEYEARMKLWTAAHKKWQDEEQGCRRLYGMAEVVGGE